MVTLAQSMTLAGAPSSGGGGFIRPSGTGVGSSIPMVVWAGSLPCIVPAKDNITRTGKKKEAAMTQILGVFIAITISH
jgi:hypothetical protein